MSGQFKDVIEAIDKCQRFMVVAHINPEGDAVGSLLGMASVLRDLGKDVVAYLEDPVPGILEFIPGADLVKGTLEGEGPFDCTVACDCGDMKRLGDNFNAFEGKGTIINLDHHVSNDEYGDINVVISNASSAGEVVYRLCKEAGYNISKETAIALYVAIVTDTGSFRYDSSIPEAFEACGELVRIGASPWDISKRVFENYPVEKIKLTALALNTLDLSEGGGVATLTITDAMMDEAGATPDHVDGIVNYARSIEGVEVAVLIREIGEERYKLSMRSKGDVLVSDVAEAFGGGGHIHAAGCVLDGSIEEVKEKIVGTLEGKMGKQ